MTGLSCADQIWTFPKIGGQSKLDQVFFFGPHLQPQSVKILMVQMIWNACLARTGQRPEYFRNPLNIRQIGITFHHSWDVLDLSQWPRSERQMNPITITQTYLTGECIWDNHLIWKGFHFLEGFFLFIGVRLGFLNCCFCVLYILSN